MLTRYELRLLQEQADRACFHLTHNESTSIERQSPKLLQAWRTAEAAADYLQILIEREIASAPENGE